LSGDFGHFASDLTAAHVFAAAQPCEAGNDLTGQNLGGLILTPGAYCFSSVSQLTGKLTLDAQNNPNAVFLFRIGSTLTTASGSSVVFLNKAQSDIVFWQVGSSAILGTSTAFAGNILALTSITLNTSASINCGRALARNGGAVPEPSTASLLLLIGVPGLLWLRKRRAVREA
jgi:Ice-binding-like